VGVVLSIVPRPDKPHGFVSVTRKREPGLWAAVARHAPDTMRRIDGREVATIVFQAADVEDGGGGVIAEGAGGLLGLRAVLPTWRDKLVTFEAEYSEKWKRWVAHRVRIATVV
jgi:hypothetical protein